LRDHRRDAIDRPGDGAWTVTEKGHLVCQRGGPEGSIGVGQLADLMVPSDDFLTARRRNADIV